ncbi:MAG: DNA polymerase II [Desulfurococcaceae archaeon]
MGGAAELEFYLLDVSYEVVAREPHVILWGITRDGRRVLLRDTSFRPYFYAILERSARPEVVARRVAALSKASSPILSVEHMTKKYFGVPVEVLKIVTAIPEYVREYREAVAKVEGVKEVVEADIRFSLRYVLDKGLRPCAWHVVKAREVQKHERYRIDAEYLVEGEIRALDDYAPPRDIRIMAFDIEVYSKSGAPRPERDPVIIVGLMRSGDRDVKSLVANGLDDRQVLREFVEEVLSFDPDVIVGYNSDNFDWPYLLERGKALGIKLDVGRVIDSAPQTSTYGHVSVAGRLNVDLYRFAEEIQEVKVKTLDNVAEYLGVMKRSERVNIDYTELPKLWDDPSSRHLVIRYNSDDVRSTMGIAEKILPFAMQLSSITGLPLDQVGAASVGNRLEWFLMREAARYSELVPNRIEKAAETYKGAVVLEPLKGIHENVAVLDFTSMYPSIMIKYNVGPDTISKGTCDEATHYIAPEVGHCFRKEPPGFFKNVLTTLLHLRKRVREEMKKYPVESYEYRLLDERQRALKVLANATYGYMGWVGARWYCRECAEAVTAWGRNMILTTIRKAERELGVKVIYGDTDSLFVKYDEALVNKLIEFVEHELGFDIKIDKLYRRVFFTEAKKRYAGITSDGRVDIVGFEAVRGDWSELAKEVQEAVTEILLREGDLNKAITYVRGVVQDLRSGRIPISKLVIWKTLTKKPEEYDVDAPHVSAARKLSRMGYKVDVGDKIGYVVVKGRGKISERAEPYITVKDASLVDADYYIDHQVLPAALRLLEYFGVTEAQLKKAAGGQRSLADFLSKRAPQRS